MNTQHPKVVLIGGASVFFARQPIWSMVTKQALSSGTLTLVDPNEERLGWLARVAERAIEASGVDLKLEVTANHKDALEGADFVLLAFAVEGVKLRGVDADISTKYGMTMCSADTIGPGGIMRTVREIPRQNEILNDIIETCPDAWVINWVNPTTAMSIGMFRHFPQVKSFGLCDGPHNPRFDDGLIIRAGIVESAEDITDDIRKRVKIRSAGINHFNWLVEMTFDGEDMTPRIKDALKKATQAEHIASSETGKRNLTNQIASQLADKLGFASMCIWHTQEYLPYFQGHDVAKGDDVLTIKPWDVNVRWEWMNQCWDDMKATADGTRDINDFLDETNADHASDIIETMLTGNDKKYYINTPNNGSITNMTDDAYVEVLCDVDMQGPHALPFGDMPRPLLGKLQCVLDEHELAVEAAVTFDRKILLQAFLASMITVSIPDAEACMNELLETEREYLPEQWFA